MTSDELHLLIDPAEITDGFLQSLGPVIYRTSGQPLEIIEVCNVVK